MTIDAAKDYLREHWPNIQTQRHVAKGYNVVVDLDLE
jgi:hypothetical protein